MQTRTGSNVISLRYARMAPDDGAGGGAGGGENNSGGTENQQAGNQQADQKVTSDQKLDAILARMGQQDAVIADLASKVGSPKPDPKEEDETTTNGFDDPVTKELIRRQKQTDQRMAQTQDQMDRREFLIFMKEEGIAEEDAEQALRVHGHWLKHGMNFVNGQPPSRIDAARYFIGATYKQRVEAAIKKNSQTQSVQQREVENAHAFLERSGGGGGGYRAEYPDDFETKPLSEQSKVIGQGLDKKFPGGW